MICGLSFFAQAKLADAPPEPCEVAAAKAGLLHFYDGEFLHTLEYLDHQLSLSFIEETALGLILEVAKIERSRHWALNGNQILQSFRLDAANIKIKFKK
jgi:hypothetical protein